MALWNTVFNTTPSDKDTPKRIAAMMRELKSAIYSRLVHEHETYATGSTGSEAGDFLHREGSAKAYACLIEPSYRPDGATALDVNDNGRLWIDKATSKLWYYDGDTLSWVAGSSDYVDVTTNQNVDGQKTFLDEMTLNANVIQAWGYDGIARKPATVSGTSLILKRNDSTYSFRADGDEDWHTLSKLTIPYCIPSGSTGRIYFQQGITGYETGNADYVRYRYLINGSSKYTSGYYDSDGYTARAFDSVAIKGGDVISVQMAFEVDHSCETYLVSRYLRVYTSSPSSLTDWEKQYCGLG